MKITNTPISYPSYLNEEKQNRKEKDENNPANAPSSYEVAPEKSDEESRGNTGFQPEYLLHKQRQKKEYSAQSIIRKKE